MMSSWKIYTSAVTIIAVVFMGNPLRAQDEQAARARFEEMNANHQWSLEQR